MDRDPDGKAAGDRNFGLTDEGRQRAKELSAVVQCDLRVAAARAAVAEEARVMWAQVCASAYTSRWLVRCLHLPRLFLQRPRRRF